MVVDANLGLAQAIKNRLARLLAQVLPGCLRVLAQMLEHSREDLRIVVGPAEERPEDSVHRKVRVLDQALGVHDAAHAQAIAVGAGAVRRIEAEVTRLEVVDRVAVYGAGKREGVLQQLALRALRRVAVRQEVETDAARGEFRGLLHALGDAAERVLTDDDAVNHDLDRVLVLLVELDVLVQLANLAVHANAAEALLAQVLEELLVLALAAQHHRCQHVGAAALSGLEDLVRNLVRRLARDGASALRAVRRANARVEKAQVVVDLRHSANGRARVAARGLLVDGDRGRQAVDRVQVRLVHLAQEHARVAAERLDVAALALRVDGVEGQARLAGARESRNYHELVAWNGDVYVAQVVLARALDDDGV